MRLKYSAISSFIGHSSTYGGGRGREELGQSENFQCEQGGKENLPRLRIACFGKLCG